SLFTRSGHRALTRAQNIHVLLVAIPRRQGAAHASCCCDAPVVDPRASPMGALLTSGCALPNTRRERWIPQTDVTISTSRGRSDAGGDGASGTWMCRGRACGQGRLPERGAIPTRGAAAPPEASWRLRGGDLSLRSR